MDNWIEELMDIGAFSDAITAYNDMLKDMTPGEAAKEMYSEFEEELSDVDDGPFVHLAIAAGQLEIGRLLVSSKKRALESIHALREKTSIVYGNKEIMDALDIAEYEITNNKHKRKPMYVHKCTWKKNDVYIFLLDGERSKEVGLCGHYAIFRMAFTLKWGSPVFPYCYVSVSAEAKEPKSRADIENSIYIRDYQYVYEFLITSFDEGEFEQLKYVGNFEGIAPPKDEYEVPMDKLPLYAAPMPVSSIEKLVCQCYNSFVLNGRN